MDRKQHSLDFAPPRASVLATRAARAVLAELRSSAERPAAERIYKVDIVNKPRSGGGVLCAFLSGPGGTAAVSVCAAGRLLVNGVNSTLPHARLFALGRISSIR